MYSYVSVAKRLRRSDVSVSAKNELCHRVLDRSISLTPHPVSLVLQHLAAALQNDTITSLDRDSCWSLLQFLLRQTFDRNIFAIPAPIFRSAVGDLTTSDVCRQAVWQLLLQQHHFPIDTQVALLLSVTRLSTTSPSLQLAASRLAHDFFRQLFRIRDSSHAQEVAIQAFPAFLRSPLLSNAPIVSRFLFPDGRLPSEETLIHLIDIDNPNDAVNYLFHAASQSADLEQHTLFSRFLSSVHKTLLSCCHTQRLQDNKAAFTRCVVLTTALFQHVRTSHWYYASQLSHDTKKPCPTVSSSLHPRQILSGVFQHFVDALAVMVKEADIEQQLLAKTLNAISAITRFSLQDVHAYVPTLLLLSSHVPSKSATNLVAPCLVPLWKVRVFSMLLSCYGDERRLSDFLHLLMHRRSKSVDCVSLSSYADVICHPMIRSKFAFAIATSSLDGIISCIDALTPSSYSPKRPDLEVTAYLLGIIFENTPQQHMREVLQCVAEKAFPMLCRAHISSRVYSSVLFLLSSILISICQAPPKEHEHLIQFLFEHGVGDVLNLFETQKADVPYDGDDDSVPCLRSMLFPFLVLSNNTYQNVVESACMIRMNCVLVRLLLTEWNGSDVKSKKLLEWLTVKMLHSFTSVRPELLNCLNEGNSCSFWHESAINCAATMLISMCDVVDLLLSASSSDEYMIELMSYLVVTRCLSSHAWADLHEYQCIRRINGRVVHNVLDCLVAIRNREFVFACDEKLCVKASIVEHVNCCLALYLDKDLVQGSKRSKIELKELGCCLRLKTAMANLLCNTEVVQVNEILKTDKMGIGLPKSDDAFSHFSSLKRAAILFQRIASAIQSDERDEQFIVDCMGVVIEQKSNLISQVLQWPAKNYEDYESVMVLLTASLRIEKLRDRWRLELVRLVDVVGYTILQYCMARSGRLDLFGMDTWSELCWHVSSASREPLRLLCMMVVLCVARFAGDGCEEAGMNAVQTLVDSLSVQHMGITVQFLVKGANISMPSASNVSLAGGTNGITAFGWCIARAKVFKELKANVQLQMVSKMLHLGERYLWRRPCGTDDIKESVRCVDVCRIWISQLRRKECREVGEWGAVVVQLGRVIMEAMRAVKRRGGSVTGADFGHEALADGASHCCVALLRYAGSRARWSVVQTSCTVIRYAGRVGGSIGRRATCQLLGATEWNWKHKQGMSGEMIVTVLVTGAEAVAEAGGAQFRTAVVRSMATLLRAVRADRRTEAAVATLGHARPHIGAVFELVREVGEKQRATAVV